MGKLEGKVALITGAARGQGRSHAVRLAEEGADILAVDLCKQIDTVAYEMSTPDDLAETVRLVEGLSRRIVAVEADVRDEGALWEAFERGYGQLGRIDIVVANAGVMPILGERARTPEAWHDAIDTMLTGVLNTVEVAAPALIEANAGGSIIIISSTAGLKGMFSTRETANRGALGYVAAKHGLVGLMRAYALSLASASIRVNTIHPCGVDTPMIINSAFAEFANTHPEVVTENALPVQYIEPRDVSNAVAFLASDEARYITGVALPVDAGFMLR
jgi:SDR family mycofactocin-dependent oxidoreductase